MLSFPSWFRILLLYSDLDLMLFLLDFNFFKIFFICSGFPASPRGESGNRDRGKNHLVVGIGGEDGEKLGGGDEERGVLLFPPRTGDIPKNAKLEMVQGRRKGLFKETHAILTVQAKGYKGQNLVF